MNDDSEPPPQRRARSLLWPTLAIAALMVAPAPLVVGIGLAALLIRAVAAEIRYVARRDRRIAELSSQAGALKLGLDPRGQAVSIPRQALAAHGLILGATGSGKTTTLMRLLGDKIDRGEPVVVIDLKGSPGFAAQLQAAAESAGRPYVQWTPDGGSHWNPLATGNATELKDKLLSTERFTEPHYRRAAERYLQLAIQVAQETSAGEPVTLAGVVRLLSPTRLALAARALPPARADQLREYLSGLTPDQHSAVRGLASRLAILTESHTGRFLEPSASGPNIDMRDALTGSGVVLFSLNSSTYGSLASLLGTLAVQDLVAATGAKLSRTDAVTGGTGATVAIDEFSALGSDNMLALLARGREAGVGVLMATQELADLERAGRGFKEQVLGTTAVKIIHRQDVPESALLVARLAGTVRVWERTYQERDGPFGARSYGGSSAHQVERYRVDPELVRSLGTGEAVTVVKTPTSQTQVVRVEPWRPAAQPSSERSGGPHDLGGQRAAGVTGWYRRGRERPAASERAGGVSAVGGTRDTRGSEPRGPGRGPQPPAPGVTR